MEDGEAAVVRWLVARHVLEHRLRDCGGTGQQRVAGGRVARAGFEQLAHRTEAERSLQLAAPRGEHPDLRRRGQAHGLDEEPRLADAGRALDKHAAGSPVGQLVHHPPQCRDLPGTVDEVGRCDRFGGDLPDRQVHPEPRGRSVEGWRLGEHLGLEGPERGAGVDAQLLGERLACPAQCRQSTRLPLGPVEGKRQEPPALLPERVLGDQCLELTDDARQRLPAGVAPPAVARGPRRAAR